MYKSFELLLQTLLENLDLSEEEDEEQQKNDEAIINEVRIEIQSSKNELEYPTNILRKFANREEVLLPVLNRYVAKTRKFENRQQKLTDMGFKKEETTKIQKIIESLFAQEASSSTCPLDIPTTDINQMYIRGLESHQTGRYRESFSFLRPILPFLATHPYTWIRVSEACLYEYFKENWDFFDLYQRLFHHRDRNFIPSHQKQMNEERPRHEETNILFTECTTFMALVMAKQSKNLELHIAAAQNHIFLMLKLRKYSDALSTLSWILNSSTKDKIDEEQMALLLLYKAEAVMFTGRLKRSIEYALKVEKMSKEPKIRTRAIMICAMAYTKRLNFTKAYEIIIKLINDYTLDDAMLENVALFGIHLANKIKNAEMFKHFITVLQDVVY